MPQERENAMKRQKTKLVPYAGVLGLATALLSAGCDEDGVFEGGGFEEGGADEGGNGDGGFFDGGPSAEQLLAITDHCDGIPDVLFPEDTGKPYTIRICRLDGAVWWRADADIDCDGGTGESCKSDPHYLPSTSAKDSKGNFIDASNVPFLVVPTAHGAWDPLDWGIKTGWSGYGSAGAIIYNGQVQYAPYADASVKKIGELSQAAAARLGIPTSPVSGGVDSGVTYIVFTGPGTYVDPIESEAAAVGLGQSLAQKLIENN